MNNTTKNIIICIASIAVLYIHSEYVIHYVKKNDKPLHERIDVLVRDSVKTHKWIENVKADIKEYEPISVSVECNTLE